MTASRGAGDWIDPAPGRVTFAEFFADWSEHQVCGSRTRAVR